MANSDKKCTILLCGGLGNQMFQYAFGRALSLRNDARLILDKRTMFEQDFRYRRTYQLDYFCIPQDVTISNSPPLIQRFRFKIAKFISRMQKPSLLKNKHLLEEVDFGKFDPRFSSVNLPSSSLIFGYWQCPKYFSDYAEQIHSDFKFRQGLSQAHGAISDLITNTNSIGVHVRRKDVSRTLGFSYYDVAMRALKKKFSNARFFVFADDPDWWKRHAGISTDTTIVSSEGTSDLEDFQILCSCKHFVISNSTFSWWAAWLGSKPGKQVIAPSREIWHQNWDILPDEWETVPVKPIADHSQSEFIAV